MLRLVLPLPSPEATLHPVTRAQLHALTAALAPPDGVVYLTDGDETLVLLDGEPVDAATLAIPCEDIASAVAETRVHGETWVRVHVNGEVVVARFSRVKVAGATWIVGSGVPRAREDLLEQMLAQEVELRRREHAIAQREAALLAAGTRATRNPLAVIAGFAQTLREGWRDLAPSDVDELLDGLDRHARDLASTLAQPDFLDVSEAGDDEFAPA